MRWLIRLRCWWKHAWEFAGGEWVLPKQIALTRRQCSRCGLWQEISQDHVNGMRFLEKSEQRIPPRHKP